MPQKRFQPQEIIGRLRHTGVLLGWCVSRGSTPGRPR